MATDSMPLIHFVAVRASKVTRTCPTFETELERMLYQLAPPGFRVRLSVGNSLGPTAAHTHRPGAAPREALLSLHVIAASHAADLGSADDLVEQVVQTAVTQRAAHGLLVVLTPEGGVCSSEHVPVVFPEDSFEFFYDGEGETSGLAAASNEGNMRQAQRLVQRALAFVPAAKKL
eukprot:TRINITY_DN3412_c0_g1_i1.p1 TRINITY_DN3412_c0_g1~~TRINITY_DN3412_c0_g1_i1.p1  ORF type:complete len:175 (-),score=33.34 TRINITY_DN3412_c0_g1_i1:44-568(-)